MTVRTARVGGLLTALLGLMIATIPPVEATTYSTLYMTGVLDLSRGFGDVCTPIGTLDCTTVSASTKAGPKNEPQVNLHPGGNTAAFGLSAAACLKSWLNSLDKKTFKGPLDLCALTAIGIITGYCDLSTGTGFATLINLTSSHPSLTVSMKLTGIGGWTYISGGNKATNLYILMSTTENVSGPGGPSCTNKTQSTFLVTASGVLKNCTGETAAGVCTP